MARATTLPFLVLVSVALLVATYNTINMLSSHRSKASEHYFDSIIGAGFRSGSIIRRPVDAENNRKRLFHVAMTSTSEAYNRWQSRIMYYWYKKMKDQPGSEMGGFTRVLHTGVPDQLMDEIPTFVVNPLPAGVDRGYIVLNRPWAFVQWLEKTDIEEDYVFMAEPDYLIMKPIPNLATQENPAAFPFFYIKPENYEGVIRKFYPESKGPVTNIDPIGNAPVIIQKSYLKVIAPTWHNLSLRMKEDADADKAFGWVLDMYAYAIASALHGVKHVLQKDFMIQPPWDTESGKKFILHYTYGCDYTPQGILTYGKVGEWRFDKRAYTYGAPPRNLKLPPSGVPESVVTLVTMVNEATSNISNWREGE